MSNRLIVAVAGSGKTTHLVRQAVERSDGRVLVTTFTEANGREIRNRIIELHRCVPSHVTVQTWFSFLLQHGAKPFQGYMHAPEIKGLLLVNGQSARGVRESDVCHHYFDRSGRIYSDKLAKFVMKCDEASGGKVFRRLEKLFSHFLIDEVQDLSGYDLNFIKRLLQSRSRVLLVGDPRQGTYSTANVVKNKRFRRAGVVGFFEDHSFKIERDETSLRVNHRCCPPICALANQVFADWPPAASGNTQASTHVGIYLVRKEDAEEYVLRFRPMQLRDSSRTPVCVAHAVMNFGNAKGLSFDRVLIYPTGPMKAWLRDRKRQLKPISRAKLYVAITRARFSVGFVYDLAEGEVMEGVQRYKPLLIEGT